MNVRADVVRIGQERSASRATMHVHLFFDRLPQILHKMEPVSDLQSLGRALADNLCIQAATIPADHLDLGMAAQPFRAGFHSAVLEDIDHDMPFKINDNGSVWLRFFQLQSSMPMTLGGGGVVRNLLELPKHRVIADADAQAAQEPLGRPPTCRVPQITDNLPDTRGATCKWTCYRGDMV